MEHMEMPTERSVDTGDDRATRGREFLSAPTEERSHAAADGSVA